MAPNPRMKALTIKGNRISWPIACACCLAGASEQVATQKTNSTFLLVVTYKKTLTLQVPYCAECAVRVRGHGSMTSWVLALVVFMALAFGGSLLGALISSLFGPRSTVAALLFPLLSCVTPFVGTFLFVRRARRNRPQAAPAAHFCERAPAVRIHSFADEAVTLEVDNEKYAAALRAANP
jgi:hypothetical protein